MTADAHHSGSPGTGPHFTIELPAGGDCLAQDEEWCWLRNGDGRRTRVRFHDYHEIYAIPGLYEELFYERLECQSPEVVAGALVEEVAKSGAAPGDLRALELGAGNGLVAAALHARGLRRLVGVDIIPEAAAAARRDRPRVYEDYLVADMTALNGAERRRLRHRRFNCLVTVAALGFGDIPPLAFARALELVQTPGWVAFNIKDAFLQPGEESGFGRFIRRLVDASLLRVRVHRRYRHRLSVAGEPLYYVAMVATKEAAIPEAWFDDLAAGGA